MYKTITLTNNYKTKDFFFFSFFEKSQKKERRKERKKEKKKERTIEKSTFKMNLVECFCAGRLKM